MKTQQFILKSNLEIAKKELSELKKLKDENEEIYRLSHEKALADKSKLETVLLKEIKNLKN